MNRWNAGTLSLLIVAFALTGCAKKSTEQASITGTGFDLTTSTEELAQLPQASSSSSQQAGVEVLPIETSPITQGVPPMAGPALTRNASLAVSTAAGVLSGNLSREQQIQTALQAAGLYNGAIDGKIGPASKRAIEQFQTQNGLKADGKVGPQTWAALERYLASTGTTTTTVD